MTGGTKAAVRAVVFNHLAGIVLAPTFTALHARGLFELFNGARESWTAEQISARIGGNRGYLQVALRLLACAGWFEQRIYNGSGPSYCLTAEGALAARLAPPAYEKVVSLIPQLLRMEDLLFGGACDSVVTSFEALVCRMKTRWGIAPPRDPLGARVCSQIRGHADGLVVGPAMVALARSGILAQLEHRPIGAEAIPHDKLLACVFDFLVVQGWIACEGSCVALTPCGLYASQIATSYGVTVSYLPLLSLVDKLLFGNAALPRLDVSGAELLVDRGMNVWGSGGAHKTYFEKVDEIIVEIFNRPLHLQPAGICDMGCGDGSFLEHLYFVVRNHTARGRVLDERPLVVVGADVNKVARQVAESRLRDAGISTVHVIAGDINHPDQLAADLQALRLNIHDLLHVRSFLDHNRPYVPPENYTPGSRTARTSGAFAHLGKDIPPDELEESLVQHLRRWVPYVSRFGLLVLELHTLPPQLTATNLDRTLTVAYDGTHGFSDQYLVELPIFLDCAREAGLEPDPRHQSKFPTSELASISINFLKPAAGTKA
jgi:hypothetical protein